MIGSADAWAALGRDSSPKPFRTGAARWPMNSVVEIQPGRSIAVTMGNMVER
jgi:hypothetical protein